MLPQISLIARAKHVYFVPVDSFNLVAMFQNPMMLMLLFGGVMVIAMPYLMVRFHSILPILVLAFSYLICATEKYGPRNDEGL